MNKFLISFDKYMKMTETEFAKLDSVESCSMDCVQDNNPWIDKYNFMDAIKKIVKNHDWLKTNNRACGIYYDKLIKVMREVSAYTVDMNSPIDPREVCALIQIAIKISGIGIWAYGRNQYLIEVTRDYFNLGYGGENCCYRKGEQPETKVCLDCKDRHDCDIFNQTMITSDQAMFTSINKIIEFLQNNRVGFDTHTVCVIESKYAMDNGATPSMQILAVMENSAPQKPNEIIHSFLTGLSKTAAKLEHIASRMIEVHEINSYGELIDYLQTHPNDSLIDENIPVYTVLYNMSIYNDNCVGGSNNEVIGSCCVNSKDSDCVNNPKPKVDSNNINSSNIYSDDPLFNNIKDIEEDSNMKSEELHKLQQNEINKRCKLNDDILIRSDIATNDEFKTSLLKVAKFLFHGTDIATIVFHKNNNSTDKDKYTHKIDIFTSSDNN